MNIGILGFGAIGKLIHSCLILKQELNVTYIDERHYHNMESTQYILKSVATGEEKNICARRCTETDKLDLIILCTKTYQTRDAISTIKNIIRPAVPIVILQNGMGNDIIVRNCIKNPYILATTDCGAYVDDHILFATAFGPVTYDQKNSTNTDLKKLGTDLIAWEAADCIKEKLFRKLVINAVINPVTAIYDIKNGEILQHKELCDSVIAELYQISKSENYRFSQEDLRKFVYQVSIKTQNNYSSMHEDLKYHRATEIDSIVGYLLNRAKEYNIEVPKLKSLYEQLKNLE